MDEDAPQIEFSPSESARSRSGTFEHVFTPKHPGSFDQHYVVEEDKLGEGSFGTIFKARARLGASAFSQEDGTGPLRAIKTVSSDVAPKRFEAEVQVQKQLDHPNIVKLFEVFQDTLKYYLVLELCTGGELFDKVVDAGGSFSESACALYMRQLLAAMNYLHNHHVAHRDVKPENLLLQSRDEDAPLKVIDFGCSRTFKPGEPMTTSLGTPLYVAPQVLRRQYDEKCDIWSCGVIMYVLLCGEPPFLGRDQDELLGKIEDGDFEFEDDWEDTSDEAKDLITQMLAKDSGARPAADALLDHAWFAGRAPEQGRLPKSLVSRLRTFKAVSQFKKIALSIAAQLSKDEDIKEMQRTFIELDENRDGSLTRAEIAHGMASHGVSLPDDLIEILQEVDTDGSGSIDYTEFIASTLTRKQYLREEVLWNVFRTFDLDGDGKIQRHEFEQVVHMSNQSDVTQIFLEADKSGDDQIDFAEFRAVMRQAAAKG